MKKRTLLLLLSLTSCSLGQSKQIVPDFHYEEGVPSLTQNGDIDPRLEDFDLNIEKPTKQWAFPFYKTIL